MSELRIRHLSFTGDPLVEISDDPAQSWCHLAVD